MSSKTVEQKLFNAYTGKRGVRLSPEEVEDLLILDNALRTRISNKACMDAGIDEMGIDLIGKHPEGVKSWSRFVRWVKRCFTL